jgi:3-oxoacyl-[acyl-carrier protein] reductase
VKNGEDVRHMFEITEQQLGKIDALINNAGVLKTMPLAAPRTRSTTRPSISTYAALSTRCAKRATRMNDGGRIVNFSTSVLALNLPGYGIYTATKAAVEAFTRVFAKALRGRDNTVNAVAPGPIATALFFEGKSGEQIQSYAKMPPLERLGEPEDIAAVVAFLVGPDAGWVNGQTLRANGGRA